jgi:hypothetical protein
MRVRTKSDLDEMHDRSAVSVVSGAGLAELAARIREALVPAADLASDRPFDFDGPTGP